MYEFYQEPLEFRRKEIFLPKYIYVNNGLNEKLLKKMTYWHEHPVVVQSNHLLVRLLQSISVTRSMDDLRYTDAVEDVSFDLAMSLRLTSATYRGKVFEDGPFYGAGSNEIIIAHAEDFNVEEAAKHWKRLEPIRFLYHPKTDLEMLVPQGDPTGSETGESVIAINIPMLALQYKKWEEQEMKLRPTSPRSIKHFVRMYVLANMLPSQLDIALFNRQVALWRGVKLQPTQRKDPFFTIDYNDKFDEVATTLFEQMSRKRLRFDAMLNNLLSSANDSVFDWIRLPETARTDQIVWALIVARLPIFSFLLEMDYRTGSHTNRSEKNMLAREMRSMRVDKDLERSMPSEMAFDYKVRLKTEIEAYL